MRHVNQMLWSNDLYIHCCTETTQLFVVRKVSLSFCSHEKWVLSLSFSLFPLSSLTVRSPIASSTPSEAAAGTFQAFHVIISFLHCVPLSLPSFQVLSQSFFQKSREAKLEWKSFRKSRSVQVGFFEWKRNTLLFCWSWKDEGMKRRRNARHLKKSLTS